ncbi:MAG: hypothetical protein RQ869_01205 [Candidatus Nanopusillus sp.]|nr:hypothetical protein [Candidatus Nanopusillus sp.]
MKSISDNVIELIVIIIILIFVIIVFFNVLKGLSYAGRPEAKFGYALAGSTSFMINPVAQGVSNAATIANDVLLGVIAVTTAIGIASGIKANYNQNIKILKSAGYTKENVGLGTLLFRDLGTGGAPIKTIASSVGNAYKKVFLNPAGKGLLAGTIGLDLASYFLNNLAHAIQAPILYYLVPQGVIALNLSNIDNSEIRGMFKDLNQTYVEYIEKQGYCSNPTKQECQNLYATYLIAKYLFYTYGETLGQSVTITQNHNEYALILFDYNSKYDVTLNDVLCMLGMMKYYDYIPLEVMYGNNVIKNSNNNVACNILSSVNPSAMSSNPQTSNVYNKLLINSYNVTQSGAPSPISSTENNPSPDQVKIIPGNMRLPNGIIIQYTYEGGNRIIVLTSISGES